MRKGLANTIGKWLILIALISYTAVMAVWAMQCDSQARCTGIEVGITARSFMGDTITQRGVIAELARFDKNIIGKRLSSINTRSIEKFLTAFSNFEDVQCIVTSGGKLRITVVPVIPEIRVFDGSDSYYINKDGKRIDANARFFCNVPIVTGHFTKNFPASKLLPVTRRIAADSVFKHLVMMVKADSPNDILLIPRVAGHVINIGDASDLDTKLHNILLAYRDIMPYQGWEKYDTISVKFNGRIVASRRDKSAISHTPEFEESIDFDADANDAIDEAAENAAAEMDSTLRVDRKKSVGKKNKGGGDNNKPRQAQT